MTQISNIPHILIVDDDAQVVGVLKSTLTRAKFKVTVARSSSEALGLVSEEPFDLVLLEMCMPDPDGFAILKQIRSQARHVRVLAISSNKNGALLEAAQMLGAVATLQKPISPHALLDKINGILGR